MAEVFAVRIKEHRGNEISAPCWPVGYYLAFKPEDHECIGPGGFATYEPCKVERASFCPLAEARGIVKFMQKHYPHVICEIRRFVEAADAGIALIVCITEGIPVLDMAANTADLGKLVVEVQTLKSGGAIKHYLQQKHGAAAPKTLKRIYVRFRPTDKFRHAIEEAQNKGHQS